MTKFLITNNIIGSSSPGTAEVLESLAANPPTNQSVNTVTSNIPSTNAATLEYVDSIFENTASIEYVDSKTSSLEASDVDAVSATSGGQFNGNVSVGSNITLQNGMNHRLHRYG